MDKHVWNYVLAEWRDSVGKVAEGRDPLLGAHYASFYQERCEDLRRISDAPSGD